MVRNNKMFKFIHMFHALFILINIVTGTLMLRGVKLFYIHWVSGLLIFSIPIVLSVITIKGKLLYFIFLRPLEINKIRPLARWTKITATALLAMVSISVLTGITMLLGLTTIIFNIHITSYILILTILPFHIIIALLK